MGLEFVALGSRIAEKLKSFSAILIISEAAEALEQRQMQQIWQVMLLCLAFTLYNMSISQIEE